MLFCWLPAFRHCFGTDPRRQWLVLRAARLIGSSFPLRRLPDFGTMAAGTAGLVMRCPSTTLADLFTLLLFADLSFAIWAFLKRWSNDEFDDGVAHGRQGRLRRRAVDSFFSAPLVRGDDAGGMRKRSWS